MRKYTCKQCGKGPMNMKELRKHKEYVHGIIMGTGKLKNNPKKTTRHDMKEAITHPHTHTHEHDESVPHSHSFQERITYLSEGAKSLLNELEGRKEEIEKELNELAGQITFLREKNF